MPNNSGNNKDLGSVGLVLLSTGRLSELLDFRSLVAFSETCRASQDVSAAARKKQALMDLLIAVVEGNEALARKITTSRPELLLESSAIVTDLSGKEIQGLTPLQAAICAGDVDMVQMMVDVLQQKLHRGIKLSFEPEFETQRQFKVIYLNGDIDSVEKAQKAKAQEFKVSMLRDIVNAINIATPEQIAFELETPGHNNVDSPLNVILHAFRAQFVATSNQELIFNPFYLLMAFELYNEEFSNLNGGNRWSQGNLFWRQVIGYIQRNMPACYLQTFAQSIFEIVVNRAKLKRNFEFRHNDKDYSMKPTKGDLYLGYKVAGVWPYTWCGPFGNFAACFRELLRTKKSGLENLFTRRVVARDSLSDQISRCVIA